MTKTSTVCDVCGASDQGYVGWIQIRSLVGSTAVSVTRKSGRVFTETVQGDEQLDFCGTNCMKLWVDQKTARRDATFEKDDPRAVKAEADG